MSRKGPRRLPPRRTLPPLVVLLLGLSACAEEEARGQGRAVQLRAGLICYRWKAPAPQLFEVAESEPLRAGESFRIGPPETLPLSLPEALVFLARDFSGPWRTVEPRGRLAPRTLQRPNLHFTEDLALEGRIVEVGFDVCVIAWGPGGAAKGLGRQRHQLGGFDPWLRTSAPSPPPGVGSGWWRFGPAHGFVSVLPCEEPAEPWASREDLARYLARVVAPDDPPVEGRAGQQRQRVPDPAPALAFLTLLPGGGAETRAALAKAAEAPPVDARKRWQVVAARLMADDPAALAELPPPHVSDEPLPIATAGGPIAHVLSKVHDAAPELRWWRILAANSQDPAIRARAEAEVAHLEAEGAIARREARLARLRAGRAPPDEYLPMLGFGPAGRPGPAIGLGLLYLASVGAVLVLAHRPVPPLRAAVRRARWLVPIGLLLVAFDLRQPTTGLDLAPDLLGFGLLLAGARLLCARHLDGERLLARGPFAALLGGAGVASAVELGGVTGAPFPWLALAGLALGSSGLCLALARLHAASDREGPALLARGAACLTVAVFVVGWLVPNDLAVDWSSETSMEGAIDRTVYLGLVLGPLAPPAAIAVLTLLLDAGRIRTRTQREDPLRPGAD